MSAQRSDKHIPALDGVRGFAIVCVFLCHYGGGKSSSNALVRMVAEAMEFGWVGVSLFFALSGFLISGILWDSFGKQGWWQRFYWRRSLRIFPLYYFALLFIFICTIWFYGHKWPFLSLLPFVVYLQNMSPLFPIMGSFPNGVALAHFWSLAVEEQFYLIWPFLLVWQFGRNISARRMCLVVWALSLGCRVFVYFTALRSAWALDFLLGRAGELVMGAYLALAVRDAGARAMVFKRARFVFPACVLAMLAIIAWTRSTDARPFPMATFGLAINGIMFSSLIALALQPGAVASFFSVRWLRWLGKISYGIYVYHMLLLSLFEWIVDRAFPNLGHNAHFVVLAAVAAVGTLIIASVSFYGFEAPIMRLKNASRKTPEQQLEPVKAEI